MTEFMSLFIADPALLIGALFLPIIIGALIMGTIAWFAGFGFTYWAVAGWRVHRASGLRRRARRAASRPENDRPRTLPPADKEAGLRATIRFVLASISIMWRRSERARRGAS